MHQVKLYLLLVVVALTGCVIRNDAQPVTPIDGSLPNVIQQAQLRRLDRLADTAAKCRTLPSEEARKTWESGFADAQKEVDQIVGPAIDKAMKAAGDDKSSVWDQI